MNSIEECSFEKKETEINVAGISVCLVIPCYGGTLPIETALAITKLAGKLRDFGITLDIISERENSLVTSVRNKLLYRYLTESSADYIFWLDDDIIFDPDDFITVLALTTKKGCVAVSYPTRTDDPKFFIKYINEGSLIPEFDTEFGLIKSQGVGMGFICMSREITQEVFDAYADKEYEDKDTKPRDIFRVGVMNGKYWGEDMSFLTELYQKFNHITYIHPWINLQHVGRKDYSARLMDSISTGEK